MHGKGENWQGEVARQRNKVHDAHGVRGPGELGTRILRRPRDFSGFSCPPAGIGARWMPDLTSGARKAVEHGHTPAYDSAVPHVGADFPGVGLTWREDQW